MNLPEHLSFWLAIPGLFLVLLFVYLIMVARGKRRAKLQITILGCKLTFESKSEFGELEQ